MVRASIPTSPGDMNRLYLEKVIDLGNGRKLYFTSYLRRDFVEHSVVITLGGNGRVDHIYFSSYHHGSVEWNNGSGFSECRLWETEDQAQEPTYLTRRYTMRLSDGEAGPGFAENAIVPDVLENMADVKVASLLREIIAGKKSGAVFDFNNVRFRKRPRAEEARAEAATAPSPPVIPVRQAVVEYPENPSSRVTPATSFHKLSGALKTVRSKVAQLVRKPARRDAEVAREKSVRERAEEGRRAARRIGKKKR